MKYLKPITIIVLLLAVGLVVLNAYRNHTKGNGVSTTSSAPEFSEKTNSDGGVDVAAVPSKLDANTWSFHVSLNTHSVDLGEDMTQVSILKDNSGKEYQPTSWNGSAPGGHHRQGDLKFSGVDAAAKELTLLIRSVGGIPERVFTWNS